MIYLLCGLPSSGKTTLANKIVTEQGAMRFTLDQRMISKYDLSFDDDRYGPLAAQEKELIWHEARPILNGGGHVVFDWSLWSRAARQEWTTRAINAGFDYLLYYLDIPLANLRQRLEARNAARPPGVHVISVAELERFHPLFEPPSASEGLNLRIIRDPSS